MCNNHNTLNDERNNSLQYLSVILYNEHAIWESTNHPIS